MSPRLTGPDTPRPYQRAAFQKVRDRDGVVVLPTGSGKTLVGCMWACHALEQPEIARILLVEPSLFLVDQTAAYYREQTDIQVQTLTGRVPPLERRKRWRDPQAVVVTPQTVVNDLSWVEASGPHAVVLDEVHHLTGESAYMKLMQRADFTRKLGLSATVPEKKEGEIGDLIGPIHRWEWSNPTIREYAPEWGAEVYDTPYPCSYKEISDWLEARYEEIDSFNKVFMSIAERMLCRDGALALENTLSGQGKMARFFPKNFKQRVQNALDLHKLRYAKQALRQHGFNKAILFANRLAVISRLKRKFSQYNPVSLVGRQSSSLSEQRQTLRKAKLDSTRLILATSAGEEGIDLPSADLLVVWSNTVNPVSYIQRLGRLMRQSGSGRQKHAIYLATPKSPDYTALYDGLRRVVRSGYACVGRKFDELERNLPRHDLMRVLKGTPHTLGQVSTILNRPYEKVEAQADELLKQGDIYYIFKPPTERELRSLRVNPPFLKECKLPETSPKLAASAISGAVFGKGNRWYARGQIPFDFGAGDEIKLTSYVLSEGEQKDTAYGGRKKMKRELSSVRGWNCLGFNGNRYGLTVKYWADFTEQRVRRATENAFTVLRTTQERIKKVTA